MAGLFELLVLVAFIAVVAAIRQVIAEQKRRKEAKAKWNQFKAKHPKSNRESSQEN